MNYFELLVLLISIAFWINLIFAYHNFIGKIYPSKKSKKEFSQIHVLIFFVIVALVSNFFVTNYLQNEEEEILKQSFLHESYLTAQAIKDAPDSGVTIYSKKDILRQNGSLQSNLNILQAAKPGWIYLAILSEKNGVLIGKLESKISFDSKMLTELYGYNSLIYDAIRNNYEFVKYPVKIENVSYAMSIVKIPVDQNEKQITGYLFILGSSEEWIKNILNARANSIASFFILFAIVALVFLNQAFSLEARLQKERLSNRIRRIFFSMPEGFLQLNINGEIVTYNESFLSMFGLDEKTVFLFDSEKILIDESGDPLSLKNTIKLLAKNAKYSLLASFEKNDDKRRVYLEIILTKIIDSGSEEVIVDFRDISEQVIVERQLKAALDRNKIEQDVIAIIASNPVLFEQSIGEAIKEIIELAAIAIKTERVSVWFFDNSETELHCLDLYEISQEKHSSGMVLFETDFKREFEYLKSSKFIDADDALRDDRTTNYSESYLIPNNITSMLDAVIRISGNNLGVICFEHVNNLHSWEQDEITFTCQIADQIALLKLSEQRRTTEKQLIATEELYRSLITTSPDGIILADVNGFITFASPAILEMFRYNNVSDALGHNIIEFVDYSDRKLTTSSFQKLMKGGYKGRNKYRFLRKDATVFIGEASSSSVLSENSIPIGIVSVIRDITQRINTEETLKNQDLRVRNLFENVPIGMFQSTLDGKYVYANYRLARVLGYSSTEDLVEISNQIPIQDFLYVVPEERDNVLSGLREHPERWKMTEISLRRKDFSVIYVRMTASYRPDPLSGEMFLYGFIEDITERKKSDNLISARLELSEYSADHSLFELMRKTIDMAEKLTESKIGFFHFVESDQKTINLQTWSTQTLQHYCNALPKDTHYDVDSAGIWVDCIFRRKPVIHNDYEKIEYKRGLPPGHAELIRELTIPVIRNDLIIAVIGVGNKVYDYDEKDIEMVTNLSNLAWDIILRKKAEIALQESEKRYRDLFNGMLNGFALHEIICNEEGKAVDYRFLEVNPAFERLTGLRASDIIGRTVMEVLPQTEHQWIEVYGKVALLRSSITYENYSAPLDKYFHVEAFSPEYKKFATVIEDITPKRANDIAIAESNKKLQQTLEKLKETQKQVLQQERLRALGQLASGIAHDINNSLTPVIMGVDFLEEDDYVVKNWANILSKIKTSTQDIANTIAKMREFYRIRLSDDDFITSDLNNIISNSIELTTHRWKDMFESSGKRIELIIDFDEHIPMKNINESELREAFINLIFNACDAMPDGGTITFRTAFENNEIILEVSDTGKGMDEKTKLHCLEPFYSTKGDKGSGLGLSMVYGIVERHKGRIEIDSVLQKGSTIRIIFPVDIDGKTEIKKRKISSKNINLPPLKILCVEDEENIRNLLSALLITRGHMITVAKNGIEASELLDSDEQFDLVITDLGMAGMDGLSLARKIKSVKPDFPIILLTGWGVFLDKKDMSDIDYLLKKPVSSNDLLEALYEVMKNRI